MYLVRNARGRLARREVNRIGRGCPPGNLTICELDYTEHLTLGGCDGASQLTNVGAVRQHRPTTADVRGYVNSRRSRSCRTPERLRSRTSVGLLWDQEHTPGYAASSEFSAIHRGRLRSSAATRPGRGVA